MRTVALLLLLGAPAFAGELALLGVRDNPREMPDDQPPATLLTIDVLGPNYTLETRHLKIRDAKARARLFHDPFVFPARADLAYLILRERDGLRCLRLSWTRGEDLGPSFFVPCADPGTRPIHVVSERIAFLGKRELVSVDLRLGTLAPTALPLAPLDLDPVANRLYVVDGPRLATYPLVATDPPERLEKAPNPLFKLPAGPRPHRAAVHTDALKIAYVTPGPSRRPDALRFVLHVADHRARMLVRRTVPGRLHDLRWIDDDRLLVTATDREKTMIHVLAVKQSRLSSRPLPARYLAPPEIVPADLLALKRKS